MASNRDATDKRIAHIVVLASSATVALGFDAGGSERQVDVWVDDLTKDEATKLLTMMGIPQPDMEVLIDTVGLKVGKLVGAADALAAGVPIAEVVAKNDEDCDREVEWLLAVTVQDPCWRTRAKHVALGRWIG